ncbi:TraY domain-containing protein [Vibrio cyclitrophicus]
MSKSRGESDSPDNNKITHVTCGLSTEFNGLLDDSVAASGRSKKVEAEMRLKDHLARYESVTSIGIATKRKTD